MQATREEALARYGAFARPTERDEDWRYGRIDDVALDAYSLEPDVQRPPSESSAAHVEAFLAAVGEWVALCVTNDGVIERLEGEVSGALSIGPAAELAAAPVGFGTLADAVAEPFPALAEAFAPDAIVVTVAPGAHLEAPVVIVHEVGSGASASFPRTFISLGESAQATVIELLVSRETRALVVPLVELLIGANATLDFHAVRELGAATTQLGYQLSRVERDGTLRSFSSALGGDYARLYTSSSLAGAGSTSQMLAAYLGKGHEVHDFRTFQDHVAPHTKSELVFKGAVTEQARSVYTGMIHIHKGARRSDASQTNRNLVLSEGAHADSVPNLDIEENDVRCSHASAVGPIDPDQRFYLESRGVPPEVADRLILLGFFNDLFAREPHEGLARYLREAFVSLLELSPASPAGGGAR